MDCCYLAGYISLAHSIFIFLFLCLCLATAWCMCMYVCMHLNVRPNSRCVAAYNTNCTPLFIQLFSNFYIRDLTSIIGMNWNPFFCLFIFMPFIWFQLVCRIQIVEMRTDTYIHEDTDSWDRAKPGNKRKTGRPINQLRIQAEVKVTLEMSLENSVQSNCYN